MQDFVILRHELFKHDGREDHWDLMLREQDQLLTWAIDQNPLQATVATVATVSTGQRLADHRLEYLDYEGPISNDRGHVKRVARGIFEWQEKENLQNWTIVLQTQGGKWSCTLVDGSQFKFKQLA